MITIKKEYSYGILAIVAIVAIVALFNLSSQKSVTTTESTIKESSDLVGEAFNKIVKKDIKAHYGYLYCHCGEPREGGVWCDTSIDEYSEDTMTGDSCGYDTDTTSIQQYCFNYCGGCNLNASECPSGWYSGEELSCGGACVLTNH